MSHESRVQYRVFPLALQDKQFITPLGDAEGRAIVAISGEGSGAVATDTDANDAAMATRSRMMVWASTGWQRVRGGLEGIVAGVIASWIGFQQILMLGRYILVRPFLADGQGTHLQLNQRGDAAVQEQSYPDYEDNANDVAHTHHRAIATSTGAWSRTSSGSAPISAAPAAIKTTSGRVRRIRFINKNAANGHWGLVANANAAITGATAPVDRVWVPPASATAPGVGVIDYGDAGIYFSTGIAIAPSTGADTYAALGAADSHYTIDWI